MNTLFAGSLVLEPQVAGHAEAMFEVLSDPAIYAYENAPPPSAAWLQARFARLESRRSPDGTEQWLNWVVRVPSGALAGYVQATVAREHVAYIAYEFASRFWRQRIGSAAVGAVLGELAANYPVRAFAAVLKSRNARSAAFLRHLGFGDAPPAGVAPVAYAEDERAMYRRAGPAAGVREQQPVTGDER